MRIDKVTGALLCVQFLFAAHYVAAKWLLVQIPPPAWVALRVTGAAVVLAALTWRWWPPLRELRPHLGRLVLLSVFGVCLNQILFLEGLSRTVPSHSALINTSIPVTTLLVAVLLRHEKLRKRKVASILLSLAGVWLLLGVDHLDLSDTTVVGDLLCLANATSFSIFLVLARPVLRALSPLVVTSVVFGFGSLGVLAYGWRSLAQLEWAAIPISAWVTGLGIILGPTVGAYFLNQWALARVESSRVALFIYLQFLLAAPLSYFLLDEIPGWRLLPAAVLVFAGVGLSAMRRPAETTKAAP